MEKNIEQNIDEESFSKEKLEIEIKKEMFFISIPIIMTALMIIFLALSLGVFYKLSIKPVILSFFFMFLINIFLTLITGSAKKSVIIQSIIMIIAIFINALRFLYTKEPFTFADFAYIFNISQIIGISKGSIGINLVKCLPYIFLFALPLIIYMYFINKYNFSFKLSLKKRLLLSLIPIAILVIFFIPPKFLRNAILNNIYYTNKVRKYTLNIEYYLEDTMLGGMYRLYLENKVSEPDNYDTNEIEKMLSVSETIDSKWPESNIIVTFSESFFDVSLLEDDITFDKDVTSNFNSLKDEGIFVNMISPSFGGISSNVEFQLLTGHSLDYFSTSYVPFMTFYKTENSKNRLSLIKELKNNGYYTKVVFGRDYYISEEVYKRLGIDEYEEKDIEEEYKGYFTSDEYLMDETIKTFNEKEPGQKMFYMNCTIQSHQTFELDKYDNYDINVKSSNLSEELSGTVLSYAQGAYDADKQLRKNVRIYTNS